MAILVLWVVMIVRFFQMASDVRSTRDLIEIDQDVRYAVDEDDEEDDQQDEIEQLRRLGELHRDGTLTDEEFAKLKEGPFASTD